MTIFRPRENLKTMFLNWSDLHHYISDCKPRTHTILHIMEGYALSGQGFVSVRKSVRTVKPSTHAALTAKFVNS